ncbi:hypothetical protein AC578_8050 [Pseudocercospora eumusae]|uniref:RBR-type E3 ubiquitin transferase n=1 Tax=Pseudocercospora eumusae TaxID=321146 RepID=A0A139GXF1_9PEZI|nr:hypothetical protein AC578_8050 [Pseudocercospora eumusae]
MVSTRRAHTITRYCISCWEVKSSAEFFRRQPMEQCEHENCICEACWQTWIAASVATQYRTRVHCPVPGCSSVAHNQSDLVHLARFTDYARYGYIVRRIRLNDMPNLNWCLNPACAHELKPNGDDLCSRCGEITCTDCHALDHYPEMTCEEYQRLPEVTRRKEEELLSSKLIGQMKKNGDIKACPNCACPIELELPSKMVKCSRCLYNFDWRSASPATVLDVPRKQPSEARKVRFIIDVESDGEKSEREQEAEGVAVVSSQSDDEEIRLPPSKRQRLIGNST